MNILYTGCYCPKEQFDDIVAHQKNPPSFAQQNVESMFLEGFAHNGATVSGILMCPVRSFPGNKLYVPRRRFSLFGHKMVQIGMLNVLMMKQIALFWGAFWGCIGFLLRTRGQERVYFSYSANPLLTWPCLMLCKLFGVKTCLYVSELPHLRTYHGQKSLLRKILLAGYTAVAKRLHHSFDAYVPVTLATGQVVNPSARPQCVVEGMVRTNAQEPLPKEDEFTVLYAGGLNKVNGVLELLQGFLLWDESKSKIWFFGQGDAMEEMKRIAGDDQRVIFFGNRPNQEVLVMQQRASILVNPRPIQSGYAVYSFPSKTLEYMQSGTALLTTPLAGMDKEYLDRVFILDATNPQAIAETLQRLSQDIGALDQKGASAKEFVLREKGFQTQTAKIIGMLQETFLSKS